MNDDKTRKHEPMNDDELIEQLKRELNMTEKKPEPKQDEPKQLPHDTMLETGYPSVERSEDFTPDFGDAFADYGEYRTNGQSARSDEPDEEEEYDDPLPELQAPKLMRKRRIMPLFVKVILYVVIVGLIAVGLGYGGWECAKDVLAFGRSSEMQTVVISESDDVTSVSEMLAEKGFIKYPWLFRLYCKFTSSEEKIHPGTYTLSYNYDYHALVSGMRETSANRQTIRVAVPEGYTCAQIFRLMEEKGVCTVAELEKAAAEHEFDYWFLEGIPYGVANRLEGFLFPDTYDFYERDDAARVLGKFLVNFRRKFGDNAQKQLEQLNEKLASRLSDRGYDEEYIEAHKFTVYELITVASMIEKETAGATESGYIASVIYNRLTRPGDFPMLQIDATIVYALGGVNRALTLEDLEIDSPYNTYKNPGLPAGPIANPGLTSIAAALRPTDTGYYYYALDRSTGMHHFSRTYTEHQKFLQEQDNA